MITGLVWHERYMWHDTGTFANFLPAGGMSPIQPHIHIENADTKRRLKNLLDVLGVTDQLTLIKSRMATEAELARVHTDEYIRKVQEMSEAGGGDAGVLTPFAQDGYQIACRAAGGVVALIDAVISGEVNNGYALVRPPGHHAVPDMGIGFCIFNNVAVGIKYARDTLGLDRVAALDWDVHHGNGTQTVFYDDPSVLTISLHQTGCYPPGSGQLEENGEGAGQGANININIPPGAGHAAYLYALESVVIPALHKFQPNLILVASGFDAGGMDPLARMLCDGETFRAMTKMMKTAATELCSGKIAMAHEGGYSAVHVPFCGLAVIEELSGISTGVEDPFLPSLSGQGGYELLQHHVEAIDAAAKLVDKIPASP